MVPSNGKSSPASLPRRNAQHLRLATHEVAIYARVSKDVSRQTTDNQLLQLRRWCADNGHVIVREYIDHVSGGRGVEHRPAFAEMLAAAPDGGFELVLFWSLDRFSRQGMTACVIYLKQLADAGVLFRSYMEPALSSDNELVRNILLACLAELAKMERTQIKDRILAGIERARITGTRSGAPIGRPLLDPLIRARIGELAAIKRNATWIAGELGCDVKTVRKYLAT